MHPYYDAEYRKEWEQQPLLEIKGIKVPTYFFRGIVDPSDHDTKVSDFIIANRKRFEGKKFLDIGTCAGINNILLTRAGFDVVGIDNNLRSINCSLYVQDLNDTRYTVVLADETFIEHANYDILIINQMSYLSDFVRTMLPILEREKQKGKDSIVYK